MIVASLVLILVAVVLLVLGLSNGSSALLIGSIAASLLAAVALVVGARQAAAAREAAALRDAGAEPSVDDEAVAAAARLERHAGLAGGGDSSVAVADPLLDGIPFMPAGPDDDRYGEPWDASVPTEVGRRVGPADADFDAAAEPADIEPADAGPADPGPADGGRRPPASGEGGDPRVGDDPPLHRGPEGASPADAANDDPADEPGVQRVTAAAAAQVSRLGIEVLVVDGRPRYHLAGCPHLSGRPAEALPASEAAELGFSPCALCRPVDRLLLALRRG